MAAPAPLLAAKLRALLAALRDDLKLDLQSPQARFRAELMDMLLARLAVEAETGFDEDSLLASLEPVIGEALTPEELAARLGEAGGEWSDGVIAAVSAAEQERRGALESAIVAAAKAPASQKRSAGELSVDPQAFTAYLRGRFPDDPEIAAGRIVPVPGGRSKGTILIDIASAKGAREIVVRKDFEASVTGTSVTYEYPVVRAAFDAGLPVPEPLWLETDTGPVGGSFIAFARVPGRAMGTLFESDASPAFVRAFAAALGRLHALDIEAAGLADTLTWGREAHPVRAMLDSFYDRYRRNVVPTPLMDSAFAWLRGQLDAIGDERALVHGDAGLHNTLGEGDRLTALLDWEFAHAGDPAEDLTYCKYLVERILPWTEFMEAYVAAGGRPIPDARMNFFTVWRTLHLSILTGGARKLFESGGDQDLRIASIGYNTFPKQLRDLAADLARVARDPPA
ncbi:phosphotransferase family protein [Sphingosinicella terrae]|uniref:phosphotransferase family protein n=1 Tax=Sphingosinicella terrae TaxID=2172047 RepID=UPI000E0D0509|nr:phosphotransferase family protein [Sphingosinicella terrae]